MKIGEFKNFRNGVNVSCGACDYFRVYLINIRRHRIELSNKDGMIMGTISVDRLDECEVIILERNGSIRESLKLSEV